MTDKITMTLEEFRMAIRAENVCAAIKMREACVKWAKADAKVCDCSAHSESECACGAWCEWKTVPMHRVIEGLSAITVDEVLGPRRLSNQI